MKRYVEWRSNGICEVCIPRHPSYAIRRIVALGFPGTGQSVPAPFRPVVASIGQRVEEDAQEWGPEPVLKMDYQMTLKDGQQLGIFWNRKTESCYLAL